MSKRDRGGRALHCLAHRLLLALHKGKFVIISTNYQGRCTLCSCMYKLTVKKQACLINDRSHTATNLPGSTKLLMKSLLSLEVLTTIFKQVLPGGGQLLE